MTSISVGKSGEDIATNYLIKQGYKIIARNIHLSIISEIDIIALDKNTLVFCEVKTRRTTACGTPMEAITKTKYEKIKKGVFLYLQEHKEYKKYRIDAISVMLKPTIEIKHLKNI